MSLERVISDDNPAESSMERSSNVVLNEETTAANADASSEINNVISNAGQTSDNGCIESSGNEVLAGNIKVEVGADVYSRLKDEADAAVDSSVDVNEGSSLLSCFTGIGLEPVLFVQNIVTQMVFVTSQDLMMDKACLVNHELSPSVCSNLPAHDTTDEIIHDQVAEFLMWRGIFETTIKFVVVLFMGPWSDRWGRRTPLILCLLLLGGESALMLLNAHMTGWPLEMMMICSIPYSLSGGNYALLMLSFAHTANATTTRRRTFRMGCLDTMWYFGKTIGLLIKPIITETGGYDGVFISAIVLYIIAATYVFFRLRGEAIQNPAVPEHDGCCRECSLDHLHDSVAAVTKKRPNRGRVYIYILIGIMMLDALSTTGEGNVRYLSVIRAVDWSSSQYSYWYALTSALSVIGGFVLFPLLTLCYAVPDALVGITGAMSRMAANLSYATVNKAAEKWLLYLGSALGSFTVLTPVAVRSMLSKIAMSDVGGVFAVMAAGESLMPYIAGPVYKAIYTATDTNDPMTYNFLSAVINATMAFTFGLLLYMMKRSDAAAEAAAAEAAAAEAAAAAAENTVAN